MLGGGGGGEGIDTWGYNQGVKVQGGEEGKTHRGEMVGGGGWSGGVVT